MSANEWHRIFVNNVGISIVMNKKGDYGCEECGMNPLSLKEAQEHDCK